MLEHKLQMKNLMLIHSVGTLLSVLKAKIVIFFILGVYDISRII